MYRIPNMNLKSKLVDYKVNPKIKLSIYVYMYRIPNMNLKSKLVDYKVNPKIKLSIFLLNKL